MQFATRDVASMVARALSGSSLRTQGPITSGLNFAKGVIHTALLVDRAVWVPAFAGTTLEGCVASVRRDDSLKRQARELPYAIALLNPGGEEEPRRGMRRTMRRGTQFDSCVNLVAQAHPATTIVEPIRFRQVVSRVAKLHQPRTIARLCAWAQVVLTSVQAVHRRLI